MGNHKFRLSDMMPNAWFYKLRDMSKSRSSQKLPPPPSSQKQPRKSWYHPTKPFDNMLIYTSPNNPKAFDTPRKSSSKKKPKRKTIYMPSPRKINPSSVNNYPNIYQDDHHFQESPLNFRSSPDDDFLESLSSEFEYSDSCNDPTSEFECPCSCTKLSSTGADIIIDMDDVSYKTLRLDASANAASPDPDDHDRDHRQLRHGSTKPKRTKRNGRKSVSRSGGVRIRGSSSPKLDSRNIRSCRKSSTEKGYLFCSDSFAIVKASFDPERDFRESMMEMIVENNIRTSKDLEELLACYLSLNSNQYHGLIIRAFEQVWFNMPQPI